MNSRAKMSLDLFVHSDEIFPVKIASTKLVLT